VLVVGGAAVGARLGVAQKSDPSDADQCALLGRLADGQGWLLGRLRID